MSRTATAPGHRSAPGGLAAADLLARLAPYYASPSPGFPTDPIPVVPPPEADDRSSGEFPRPEPRHRLPDPVDLRPEPADPRSGRWPRRTAAAVGALVVTSALFGTATLVGGVWNKSDPRPGSTADHRVPQPAPTSPLPPPSAPSYPGAEALPAVVPDTPGAGPTAGTPGPDRGGPVAAPRSAPRTGSTPTMPLGPVAPVPGTAAPRVDPPLPSSPALVEPSIAPAVPPYPTSQPVEPPDDPRPEPSVGPTPTPTPTVAPQVDPLVEPPLQETPSDEPVS